MVGRVGCGVCNVSGRATSNSAARQCFASRFPSISRVASGCTTIWLRSSGSKVKALASCGPTSMSKNFSAALLKETAAPSRTISWSIVALPATQRNAPGCTVTLPALWRLLVTCSSACSYTSMSFSQASMLLRVRRAGRRAAG